MIRFNKNKTKMNLSVTVPTGGVTAIEEIKQKSTEKPK
jgi:hypothetical protein